MPSELLIHAVHRGGMRVEAGDGVHTVSMDYPLQAGNAGLTPLQLLLASLAACSANSLIALLRRSDQQVRGLEVNARGLRRDEHPTVITEITLEFVVRGGVEAAAVERALTLSEETICPVWNMLKNGTQIATSFRIVEE